MPICVHVLCTWQVALYMTRKIASAMKCALSQYLVALRSACSVALQHTHTAYRIHYSGYGKMSISTYIIMYACMDVRTWDVYDPGYNVPR